MVTKGQLLERPVVVPLGSLCLDGIYLRGEAPGLLVASPLPGAGGSMANPVGAELAYAAAYAGRASLRLDFRGVGGSEGEPDPDPDRAAEDLREGASFLLESAGGTSLGVAAQGSGAWAALILAARDPRVDRLLLVSPPFDAAPPPGVPGLGELERPVLVVAGGEDPTLDLARELERMDACRNARLEVIPGAGRALREALVTLAHLVPPFLGVPRPRDARSQRRAPPL